MTEEQTKSRRVGGRGRRFVRMIAVTLAIFYLGLATLLFFVQEYMIFPGARFQGTEEARINVAAGAEILTLPLEKGGSIEAYWSGARNADRPVVIVFYGNGECARFNLGLAKELGKMGYNVLIPDYPGFGMSPGKPSATGIYASADACYAYLTGTEHVPPGRIGVIGRSIGGGPAIYLAAKEPIGALVTLSAFRSLTEIAGNTVHHLFPVSLFIRHRMDNLGRMKDVHCPVFIAHGTKDGLIPFDTAAALAKATTAPVTMYPVQGAGHNDLYEVGGEEMMEAVEGFLARAMPDPGQIKKSPR
ncbi:MAG TPA: alpha/beta hydrolase [Tepidisphaeraceae bacterium]|nr:alpha/beta hydrolase [Tepidisphaeraceae bacterium]